MGIKNADDIKHSRRIAMVWVIFSLAAAVLVGLLGRVYLSEDLSEYDRRLDVSENKIENINQEITNTIKPTLNTHETLIRLTKKFIENL